MTDADLNERLSVSKRWSFLRPREQGGGRVYSDAPNEAAAALTRLQAENKRLRKALKPFAEIMVDMKDASTNAPETT